MDIEKHENLPAKRGATILAQHIAIQVAAGTVQAVAEAAKAVAEASVAVAEIVLVFISLL